MFTVYDIRCLDIHTHNHNVLPTVLYFILQHDAIMLEDTVMLEFESTSAEYYGKVLEA